MTEPLLDPGARGDLSVSPSHVTADLLPQPGRSDKPPSQSCSNTSSLLAHTAFLSNIRLQGVWGRLTAVTQGPKRLAAGI